MENVNITGNQSIPEKLIKECPICSKTLKFYSLNFEETMKMCPDTNCPYPLMPGDDLKINNDQAGITENGYSILPPNLLNGSKCEEESTAVANEYDFNLDDIISPLAEGDELNNTNLNAILNDLMTSFESTNYKIV